MNRYFIAAIPPEYLVTYLTGVKQSIADKYNSKAALNQPPHITLVPPFELEDNEVNKVDNLITEYLETHAYPFLITLQNYGNFSPKVIFMDVVPNDRLTTLANDLTINLQLKEIIKSSDYNFHPHITVAFKDLTEDNYTLAWKEYKDKKVYFNWDLNQISLLKYENKSWIVIKNYSLKS